mgnify:CR=1 FL=1
MDKDLIVSSIRSIPDFPKEGILFRDVTTLFGNAEAFREVVDAMYELYKDKGITKVCGLAYRLGAGFVTIRKPGKLPCETYSEEYMKEYGKDTLEIHTDALTSDDVVLLHDDLLATGGTAVAALNLIRKFSPKAIYANFIIELAECDGMAEMPSDIETTALLKL